MARETRCWSSLLLKLGLGFGTFVGFLALVEATSYVFGRFEGPRNPLQGGYIELVGRHDPLLFWSLRPNFADESGRIRTNSHGLRGPEIQEKSPDELRILSLGESTTFAPRLPLELSYSSRLEEALSQDPIGRRVRVINAGVSGYTVFQGYQYLKHRGIELEPDCVMLYFGFNDFLPVAFLAQRAGGDGSAAGLSDWELFDRRQGTVGRLRAFLTARSNLFRALVYSVAGRGQNSDVNTHIYGARPRVPEADRMALLNLIAELCRSRGIELVLIIPWYRNFEDHASLLREFAVRHRVSLVDLPAMLREDRLPKPRSTYFVDDVHPNAEGHALVASAIHDVLRGRRRQDLHRESSGN